jgi:hypothetical protein
MSEKDVSKQDSSQTLNLATVTGFDESVAWLTNNVILGDPPQPVLELDIRLPAKPSDTHDHA